MRSGTSAPPFPGGAIILFMLTALYAPATPAAENTIAVETGVGFHHSTHTEALFVRYQREAPIFGAAGYYEAVAGGWNGPNGAGTFGLARGLRLVFRERNYFAASAGLSVISDTTDNLGTPLQITFYLALGRRSERLDLSLGYVHYSNGKYFFGWDGPNYGENFVTLGVGWRFE